MPAKSPIRFFKEEVRFRLDHALKLKKWISTVIILHRKKTGEINFIFCSDRYLLSLNKKFLNHSTYTDILTFNTSEEKHRISGDVFISVDRVRNNAMDFNVSFSSELHRVMIHGILHLIGFTDKTAAEKERMRKLEDACLARRKF